MNGIRDYYGEYMIAHRDAERELFNLITAEKTRNERMVVSSEFRKELWGDERPFMLSMEALNKQAIALLEKTKQPLTQKNLNRAVMTMRRRMKVVFGKKSKSRAA